jgi:hypothetical protein
VRDSDEPVTVVQPDPPPGPRRIAGPVPSRTSSGETLRTVVDHPRPLSGPAVSTTSPAAPTAPADRPPPPAADPTSVPLPAAE